VEVEVDEAAGEEMLQGWTSIDQFLPDASIFLVYIYSLSGESSFVISDYLNADMHVSH